MRTAMSDAANKKMPGNFEIPNHTGDSEHNNSSNRIQVDHVLAEMEKALNDIVSENPRIDSQAVDGSIRLDDLKAVLEVSLAINASLDLEEILQAVMTKAVELLSAERGFIML